MQAPKCLELKISDQSLSEEAFELLCNALNAAGTAEETDVDSRATDRIAWFTIDENEPSIREAIEAAVAKLGLNQSSYRLNSLEQQDWETAWQRDWHGMPIGTNLWVRPSFCEAAPGDKTDIVLDPGMAFGTGTHPTTQLCLEAVERICKENRPQNLLDMGAGSGILAIAALKLGSGPALAIDMEEESVEACLTNAAINSVTLEARLDDTPPTAQFDLVVANILAAPLVWMAKELAACVSNRLVLSGLLIEHVDDVSAAYQANGLTEVRRDTQGDWASVELIREASVQRLKEHS